MYLSCLDQLQVDGSPSSPAAATVLGLVSSDAALKDQLRALGELRTPASITLSSSLALENGMWPTSLRLYSNTTVSGSVHVPPVWWDLRMVHTILALNSSAAHLTLANLVVINTCVPIIATDLEYPEQQYLTCYVSYTVHSGR